MKTFLIATLAYVINAITCYVISMGIDEDSHHYESMFYMLIALFVCTSIGVVAGLLMGRAGKPKA